MKAIFIVTIFIGISFGVEPDLFGQTKTKFAPKTIKACKRPSLDQPQSKITAPPKNIYGERFSIIDGDDKSGGGMGSGKGTGQGTGNSLATEKKTTPAIETTLALRDVSPNSDIYIISKPSPSYTEEARAEQVNGQVILRVAFLASGKIGKISVVKGLPKGLTEKAKAAAEQIKFEPARKNCVNISKTKSVSYSFYIY